jgi:hypothetical protein
MTDDPINLDGRRGIVGRKSTELRRRLQEVHTDQVALRQNQEELENRLLSVSVETWPDVAAKAQYLIRLFGATREAEDPRRKKLIAQTLDDLTRLSSRAKPN